MRLKELLAIRPPKTLYHYTNQQGLLGIIGERKIWATEINYLNDHSEFNYACLLAKEIIDEFIKNHGARIMQDALTTLKRTIDTFPEIAEIYVFSLSIKDDLLSQWRAYGDKSSGYSIGFDSLYLRQLIQAGPAHLLPCIYDEGDQRDLMHDIVNHAINSYMIASVRTVESNEVFKTPPEKMFVLDILRYGPVFKNYAFEEEREWRLIISDMAGFYETSFRAGKSTLVPYAILDFDRGSAGSGLDP